MGRFEGDAGELRTARLVLRRPMWTDVEAVLRIHRDPRAYAHNPGDAIGTRTEAEARFRSWDEHWRRNGFGYWTVRRREPTDLRAGQPDPGAEPADPHAVPTGPHAQLAHRPAVPTSPRAESADPGAEPTGPRARGEVVGFCGVKVMELHGRAVLNLFYRLDPAAWGDGIATEAAAAVVAWALERLPGRPLIARVRPDNTGSLRVATRAGLRRAPELDTTGEDGPDWIFAVNWPAT